MIIILSLDKVTVEVAARLAEKTATKLADYIHIGKLPHVTKADEDHTLTLIDLSATGAFQDGQRTGKGVEILIDKIEKSGWHKNIDRIDLYISDVIAEDSSSESIRNLLQIAEDLAHHFHERYHSEVVVNVVTDYSYDLTIIVPPSRSADENWSVYGIMNKDLPKGFSYSLDNFKILDEKSKKLLWEGGDLNEYFAMKPSTKITLRGMGAGL